MNNNSTNAAAVFSLLPLAARPATACVVCRKGAADVVYSIAGGADYPLHRTCFLTIARVVIADDTGPSFGAFLEQLTAPLTSRALRDVCVAELHAAESALAAAEAAYTAHPFNRAYIAHNATPPTPLAEWLAESHRLENAAWALPEYVELRAAERAYYAVRARYEAAVDVIQAPVIAAVRAKVAADVGRGVQR